MSNNSIIYYDPQGSESAYINEVILNNMILESWQSNLDSVLLNQLITLVSRAVAIIIPLLRVNYENRAEQVDIVLVEQLCRSVRNILAMIARNETNQILKANYIQCSRACWAISLACHNSKTKISYHATEYLIDPDKYQPQIKINPLASQIISRHIDSLNAEINSNQMIQTIINGISFADTGVSL